MGRQKKSLNSSIITVNNNSLLEDVNELEYSEFIKRFEEPDSNGVELIGCADLIGLLKERIEELLDPGSKNDFALLTGPSGTGKTTIVRKLAEHYSKQGLSFFYLKSSWTLNRRFGAPEVRLKSLFDEAIRRAPSLIFIDKLDSICSEKRNDLKDRVFNVLEDEFENLRRARVLVLAATNQPEVLDSKMRETRYFSEEIGFTLPKRQDRIEYLEYLLSKNKSNLTNKQIEEIADASHCYSYLDLDSLYRIASRYVKKCGSVIIDYASMRFALSTFKPAATKFITTPHQPLKWEDIGGIEAIKRKLRESIIEPLKHASESPHLGTLLGKGALLYGPPGCSKTMLAQALATESGYNFISIKGPELLSKYVGDSEAAVRKLYRNASEIAPCIIFFDEIDGFTPERNDSHSSSVGEKVVTQLLPVLDGVGPLDKVFTIAATNRPDRIDRALLRPGRLDPAIYIPLPSKSDRREIFKIHMRSWSLKLGESMDSLVDNLAAQTPGYSGAEIKKICQEAFRLAWRHSPENIIVEWKHFMEALDNVKPGTTRQQLEVYKRHSGARETIRKKTVLQRIMRALSLKKSSRKG